MCRLFIIAAPILCISSAIGLSHFLYLFSKELDILSIYLDRFLRADLLKYQKTKEKDKKLEERDKRNNSKHADFFHSNRREVASIVITVISFMLMTYLRASINAVQNLYSNPTIFMKNSITQDNYDLIDDLRESCSWIQQNTNPNSKILSWWDYGYHLNQMANRSTIIDNHTSNTQHIGLVGLFFSLSELDSLKLLQKYKILQEIDYVFVHFGGLVGFENDDLDKFPWMMRIAEQSGVAQKNLGNSSLSELDYMHDRKYFTIGNQAPERLLESTLYKLLFHGFYQAENPFRDLQKIPPGYDINRQEFVSQKKIQLEYFEEVYTSKNWLYRIYRIKKNSACNRGFC